MVQGRIGQGKTGLLLRRLLPLAAVAVLGAPLSAAAAGSQAAPDAAPPESTPTVVAPAPDPTPTAASQASSAAGTESSRAASVPSSSNDSSSNGSSSAVSSSPVTARSTLGESSPTVPAKVAAKTQTARPHRRRGLPHPHPVVVRDVMPFAVDVPAGLGSVAGSIRDDSAPILAALALLAAAAAAASGTGLVLAWSRSQGPAA